MAFGLLLFHPGGEGSGREGDFGSLLMIRLQEVVKIPIRWRSIDNFFPSQTNRLAGVADFLQLYRRSDPDSETLLYQKISAAKLETLSNSEKQWWERLRSLFELRALVFGKPETGKLGLRQSLSYQINPAPFQEGESHFLGFQPSAQDILESATQVAKLYWKLYETATGDFKGLVPLAQKLYSEIFGLKFESSEVRNRIEILTDTMQRDNGIPFLVLNSLLKKDISLSRTLTQNLLVGEVPLDEELRTGLYWLNEMIWFTQWKTDGLKDFETTIRYLYHLCFTNPERTGFLEIDSLFFSQFETVNELAREGFLFKESLIEKILSIWRSCPSLFDSVFQPVLEGMTQKKSKIYDSVVAWENFWKREKKDFCKEYLYVVEGNLFYACGLYEEAIEYFEKALTLSPSLRPALFNLLFCYAKFEEKEKHRKMVERIQSDPSFFPAANYVIADSYLLIGDMKEAERFYSELKKVKGWEQKTDYYKSTFCYENGLHEQALFYGKKAFEKMPNDSSVQYHLSVCYHALSQYEEALKMLNRMDSSLEIPWLSYYRFTLEKDLKRFEEATQTLLKVPTDYFQDPDEWKIALDFARSQNDLVLLRHLKRKS